MSIRNYLATIVAVTTLGISASANADQPVELKLSVEPVANAAELTQLMRQNTVRVALQRHRLWEEAAEEEMTRQTESRATEPAEAAAEGQARDRHRTRTKEASHRDPASKQERKRTQTRTQATVGPTGDDVGKKPAEPADKADKTRERARLREALRSQRSGSGDSLERKLEQRLRERKRLLERSGSGSQKQQRQGSAKKNGRRGRR